MPSRSRTYRDAWGIPHLRAADPLQLAHGQGRNAARDRAWQIEVERHRSQGTTAAFLGTPALLDPDTAAWDRRMDADSTSAGDYARLRSAVVRRIAAAPQLRSLAGPLPYPAVFEPWLNLTGKVAFALEETAGTDPVTWGELHRLAPLWALPGNGDEEPWPGLGGDHDCVLATSSVPGLTDLSSRGPSARYVWDLADRDNSLWIVPLGANGTPGHAHHRDQLPLWASGRLAPVVTDFARLTEEADEDSGDGTQGRISNWKSNA